MPAAAQAKVLVAVLHAGVVGKSAEFSGSARHWPWYG
jgi:hypothetical protein